MFSLKEANVRSGGVAQAAARNSSEEEMKRLLGEQAKVEITEM